MKQPRERRDDQPAFVLHAYPYRETSLIVEALTADYGRVALVARGAKRPRSELRGVLQAFQPLTSVVGGQRRAQDAASGPSGAAACRWSAGSALLCGFYLNELLLKLLPREDPHPQLFRDYEATLGTARRRAPSRRRCCATSRCGCWRELGYALPLTHEADTGAPVDPARAVLLRLRSRAAHAPSPEPGRRYPLVRGATLLALAQQRLQRCRTRRPRPSA